MNSNIHDFFKKILFHVRIHARILAFVILELLFFGFLIIGTTWHSPWLGIEVSNEYLKFILNLLVSINFLFFSLSFTAYTLAVKLTHKSTFGKWITERIQMKYIVICFLVNILSLMLLFSFLQPPNTVFSEIFGIFLPSILIVAISVYIVFKTIYISSTKAIILNFLKPYSQNLKLEFDFRFNRELRIKEKSQI